MRLRTGFIGFAFACIAGACENAASDDLVPLDEVGIDRAYRVKGCSTTGGSQSAPPCNYTFTNLKAEFIDSGTLVLARSRTFEFHLWMRTCYFNCSDTVTSRWDATGTYVLNGEYIELSDPTGRLPVVLRGNLPPLVRQTWAGPDTLLFGQAYAYLNRSTILLGQ